jgi:hypothetical protein
MDPALQKLMAALQDYLAQGGDTPVAPEAQALMDAIQQSGAVGDQGAEPSMEPGLGDLGGAPDPTAADPYQSPDGGPPPDAGPPMDMPPPQPNAKTFEGARAGAKDRLKKLNKR